MGIGYTDGMGSPEHSKLIVAYSSKDTVMVISGLFTVLSCTNLFWVPSSAVEVDCERAAVFLETFKLRKFNVQKIQVGLPQD